MAQDVLASSRLVTVEVGQGEQRQWLVLGVTPQGITALHTMPAMPLMTLAMLSRPCE